MNSRPNINQIGTRIAIIGPISCGKSTLADALGKKINLPVFHLDQLRYQPNTDWFERPKTDFAAEHDRIMS